MKIVIICGTRPEAIKLIPLYLAFKDSQKVDVFLVSTGQHQDMLEQVFAIFDVNPDYRLDTMIKGQSLGSLTGRLFIELDRVFAEIRPHMAVVQGDTSTAMVGAQVAFYYQTKIIHVEAGLRTYDKYSPFPEEINRQVISVIADYNFTPTNVATKVLESENREHIYQVGNTVIDALYYIKEKIKNSKPLYDLKYRQILSTHKKNILVTSHRRENFDYGLRHICNALKTIAKKYQNEVQIVFPVHLNPIIQNQVKSNLSDISNIILMAPIPYDELIFLMANSYIILTDSGGIQEEAPALNKPVIVLREITERPEGVAKGCALLAGNDEKNIIACFEKVFLNAELYSDMANTPCPYGDGHASQRIVEIVFKDPLFKDLK